jgi:hypothetical protein
MLFAGFVRIQLVRVSIMLYEFLGFKGTAFANESAFLAKDLMQPSGKDP